MKVNSCENLLRRSADNHLLTYRHNRREDEILKDKFSFYQRQIRLIDRNIHMAERRFEQHATNDLGLVISCKRKPLETSPNHSFYYPSTNKNWTIKEYSVEPLRNILQHKNLYEHAFQRRSEQYLEELKEKNRLQKLRKEQFLNQTEPFILDSKQNNNDWPLSDHARVRLPTFQETKLNHVPKLYFSIEM